MARLTSDMQDAVAIASISATAEAFYELGILCAAGRDSAPDLVAAHKWFNIAIARGCREALERRAELSAEMSREEIWEAQRAARDFLTRH